MTPATVAAPPHLEPGYAEPGYLRPGYAEAPSVGSLCTGYGGLDLAVVAVLGGRVAWVADNDKHAALTLAARFPGVPNLGDITTVDWHTVPRVEVVTAGFPCQDISYAGKGAGLTEGTRSGIWAHIAHAVRVLRPGLVFVENVAALRRRGLDRVLADLAQAGYDTAWTCLRASDIGAPHRRERLFLLAHPTHPSEEHAGPARSASSRACDGHAGASADPSGP